MLLFIIVATHSYPCHPGLEPLLLLLPLLLIPSVRPLLLLLALQGGLAEPGVAQGVCPHGEEDAGLDAAHQHGESPGKVLAGVGGGGHGLHPGLPDKYRTGFAMKIIQQFLHLGLPDKHIKQGST